jgi:hypothetical protein
VPPTAWAEVALPPPIAEAVVATPVVVPVVLPTASPVVSPVPAKRAAVRLGFADGSSVEVDDASGESQALLATASRLLGLADS